MSGGLFGDMPLSKPARAARPAPAPAAGLWDSLPAARPAPAAVERALYEGAGGGSVAASSVAALLGLPVTSPWVALVAAGMADARRMALYQTSTPARLSALASDIMARGPR